MMMRQVLSWLLVLFGAFAGVPAQAADLRIGLSADVTTIDPHHLPSQPNLAVGYHVFDALTHVDEKARIIPGLAVSWRTLDPTTWEFKLRPGVKFHDGAELTAEDVVFSLDRPPTIKGGGFGSYVAMIQSKTIVDKLTVRIVTRAPYGALAEELNSVMIVSKKHATGAASEDFDSGKATIGTGPYKFVRFARGDRVEYVRNNDYWGGRPAWEKLTLRIMPTDPVRTAALLAAIAFVITLIIWQVAPRPDHLLAHAVFASRSIPRGLSLRHRQRGQTARQKSADGPARAPCHVDGHQSRSTGRACDGKACRAGVEYRGAPHFRPQRTDPQRAL